MKRKIPKTDLFLALFILLFGVFIYFFHVQNPNTYERYNSSTLSYERAKVLSIDAQQLTEDTTTPGRYYGEQQITAQLLSGSRAGETVSVYNNLSTTHNVLLSEGQDFVACLDQPDQVDSYITVYNYYRTPVIYIMIFLFLAIMVLIGRMKGFKSAVGLLFTFATILFLMVPMIYHGYSPAFSCILTVIVTTAVSLLLLNGASAKTFCATASTALGVVFAGIIFSIFAVFFHISGFNTSEAEDLILISQSTGLKIQDVLFASILIASLGAVMDVAMSISTALHEVMLHSPQISAKELFFSGIRMGKDMIGTMSNTLILAFAGSCLTTILVFFSYHVQYQQLMNSDFITLEIAQGLSGTMAVVLTVPIASLISAFVYHRQRIKKGMGTIVTEPAKEEESVRSGS